MRSDDPRHGTLTGYADQGCRCPRCKASNTERHRKLREARHATEPPSRVHGTSGGYSNWGCRCAECQAAHDAKNRRAYEDRISRPVPDRVHGTVNGYNSYGCRCELCRVVAFEARAERRKS